jgi:hypothetical protein
MDRERITQFRAQAMGLYEQGRDWFGRLPAKARIVLGLFLFAALLMALHTALSGKDATLHLTVQHGFRNADFSLWIDDDLAYSGKLAGSMKRKFGVIPASVQGSLSEILPVSAGTHKIRVRVESEGGSTQQDSLAGDFARNTERELSISARPSGLSLEWRATNASSASSGSGWFVRYAGALFLTLGGSIISALTGFALKELPAHIRTREDAGAKAQSTAAGQ